MKSNLKALLAPIVAILSIGCETTPKVPALATVPIVDLSRYMGRWYVIGNIPTFVEKGAHNATETYELKADGSIGITFRFLADSFDGTEKTYHPVARVVNQKTNATWQVQFVWPFWSDYLIVDLANDYSWVVVGVPSRSYVWIMGRSPVMDQAVWDGIVQRLQVAHYDVGKILKIPQR